MDSEDTPDIGEPSDDTFRPRLLMTMNKMIATRSAAADRDNIFMFFFMSERVSYSFSGEYAVKFVDFAVGKL